MGKIAQRLDAIGSRLGMYLNEETERFSAQWFAQNAIIFGGFIVVLLLIGSIDNSADYVG